MSEEVRLINMPFDLWLGRVRERVWSMVHEAEAGEPETWIGERLQGALALAYHGCIEDGDTLFRDRGQMSRARILEILSVMLSPKELALVDAVAVPRAIRTMSGPALERLARQGSFKERVQSLVWLQLTGWTVSEESTLPKTAGDWFDDVDDTLLGEMCIDRSQLRAAIDQIAAAASLFNRNGPPPLAIAGATLGPPRPGWCTVTFMVPASWQHDPIEGFTGGCDPQPEP